MENATSIGTKKSKKGSKSETYDDADDKTSVLSIVCRICFDDTKDENIITPCHCKGTVAFVHRTCLEKWLAESNTTSCELCHHVYETERVPKYSAKQSIWQWVHHQPQNLGFRVRRIRCDLIACAILTPLAIVITYICLFSADYYNQQKYSNIPTARWTSISLLIMIAIMLFGYYIWVYVVVGYHGRMWYYWWQRECVVRYIPPTRRSIQIETMPEVNDNTENMVTEIAVENADNLSDNNQQVNILDNSSHASTVTNANAEAEHALITPCDD